MSVLNQKIEDASNHSSGVPYLVQLVCFKKNIQILHIIQRIWFLNNHYVGKFFLLHSGVSWKALFVHILFRQTLGNRNANTYNS